MCLYSFIYILYKERKEDEEEMYSYYLDVIKKYKEKSSIDLPKLEEYLKALDKAYEAKFNSTPVSFAALAYDCVFLLKDAMEKSGKTDATTLKDTLKDISGSYVTGTLSFDENRNPVKSAVMMEIVKKDGKLTPVYNATINP